MANISNSTLVLYRRGWIDGAGFKPVNSSRDDYSRGYTDGREAFMLAMAAERERLGIGDGLQLQLAEEKSVAHQQRERLCDELDAELEKLRNDGAG